MTFRGLVVRALVGLGLVSAAVTALASSVVLHGSVLVVVVVAAAVAACIGYGLQDAGRAAAFDLAWKVAAATVAAIVLVTGLVVLAGGAVAALVIGLAAAIGGALWLTNWLPRARAGTPSAAPVAGSPAPAASWKPPVSLLPTEDLGSEWLRTTSALACPVEPQERQDIIRRRQETLDELERRDPAGFARWLAAGPAADSDPAVFVRGDRTTDSDSA